MPDIVKVGFTTRSPMERAAELGRATGIPVSFIVVYQRPVLDCKAAEDYLHTKFQHSGYRVAQNREFFNAPVWEVVDAVANLPHEYLESGSDNGHEEGDQSKQTNSSTEIWRDIWNQAVAAHFGLGDEIRDSTKARELYRSAAKLGCSWAFYRIGMIDLLAAQDRKAATAIVGICRDGAERGNYICHLLMAKIFILLGDSENAEKSLSNFFRQRGAKCDLQMEEILHSKNALAHVLGQALAGC